MGTNTYQLWLADRGIESPGSQPFDLLRSQMHPGSSVLILAQTSEETSVQSTTGVSRLAEALSHPDQAVSWVVVSDKSSLPELTILRTLLPNLVNLIFLTSNMTMPETASFPVETMQVASRPLRLIYGPTMALMNSDGDTKRKFWNQLRVWIPG